MSDRFYLYRFLTDYVKNQPMVESDDGYNLFLNDLLNDQSIYSIREDELITQVDSSIKIYTSDSANETYKNRIKSISNQINLTTKCILENTSQPNLYLHLKILDFVLSFIGTINAPSLLTTVDKILGFVVESESNRIEAINKQIGEYRLGFFPTIFKLTFRLCYKELGDMLAENKVDALPFASSTLERMLTKLKLVNFLEAKHAKLLYFLFLTVYVDSEVIRRLLKKNIEIVNPLNVESFANMDGWFKDPFTHRVNTISANNTNYKLLIIEEYLEAPHVFESVNLQHDMLVKILAGIKSLHSSHAYDLKMAA